MVGTEGIGILFYLLECTNKWVGKTVGYLERYTQQHRKDKEYGHLTLLEQQECIQAKSFDQRLARCF